MSHNAIAGFPAQRLSFSRKNKSWRKKCVDFGEDCSLLHHHLTDNDDVCPSVSLLEQEQPLVMAANEYAEKLKEKEADPLGSMVSNQAAYGGRIYDGILEPTNQMKKGRYWTDDNSILPELLVYPDRMHKNDYVRDEAGNPAKTVGAIRDINPNAHIYERVNKELTDNQYRTMPTNSEANVFADAWTEQTAPTIGDLVTAATKGFNITMPHKYVGLFDSANKNGLLHLFDEDNRGLFINDNPQGMFSKRYTEEHPYWAMAGNMAFDIPASIAAGWAIGKGFSAASNAYNAGKTAIATSTNPKMQYIRYGLGKMNGWMHGYNPKLPTLYRKVKGMPSIEKGRMVLSTPDNRFAFENGFGEESPLITNFTSDVGVRRHADGNWNWAPTLAMPGESLLGKNVISTRPSDTFTFGDIITVPINKVTAITGRGKEIEAFNKMGIRTLTSSDAQSAFASDLGDYLSKAQKIRSRNAKILEAKARGQMTFKRKWPEKDFDNYASEVQKLERASFRSPTISDYEFMDYVFNPEYTSEVAPKLDITEAVTRYPSLVGSWYGDSGRRRYIDNSDEWVNVMYDPYSPAEALFRKSKGIDLKPEWQNK